MTKDLELAIQDAQIPVSNTPEELPIDDDVQKPIYNKIQVNDIVKREKQRALEKGKEQGRMEALQQQQAVQGEQQPIQAPQQAPMQQQGQTGLGGMAQLSQADIERLIAEKAPQILQHSLQQKATEYQNQQLISDFVGKMQAAEARHPGLEEKLNQIDFEQPGMMELVKLANTMENTGDIMKEITDHPGKLGNLLSLAKGQPQYAAMEMMKLSNSIKQNQQAQAQEAQVRDPMSQLKPSQNIGVDNSSMSVTDFRKMFR